LILFLIKRGKQGMSRDTKGLHTYKTINGQRWTFAEWFGRKDATQRRAKEFQKDGYLTKIVPAGKGAGKWKWALYYRKKR
jgi:hypothetical protein